LDEEEEIELSLGTKNISKLFKNKLFLNKTTKDAKEKYNQNTRYDSNNDIEDSII